MARRSLAGLAVAAAAAATAAALLREGPEAGILRSGDPQLVAEGGALYAQHCASSHEADLEGQPDRRSPGPGRRLPTPPHDASGHTWHHTDEVLFEFTKHEPAAFTGPYYESSMPAFGGILSDADIVAALSYIKSRWPERVRQRHDEMNAAARE